MVTVGLVWMLGLAADLDVGSGQAFTTIGEAVDAAVPGDVIRVHPGTYTEDLALSASGAAGMPIRIEAVTPGMATLQGAIDLAGSDWELVDLVLVSPAGGDGITVAGDRNLLQGLDMSGGDRDGIDGGGVDNVVRQCVIHDYDAGDADAHCIVLNPGAERWLIEDNELFDCSGDGIQLYSAGVERSIVDTTIQRNLIYDTGTLMRTENAIDVKNADGLYIRNNVMWGFTDNKTLVFQKGPIGIEVVCNEMTDGFTGVEFRGEDGGTIENVLFAHNLMVGFDQYALKFDGTTGARVFDNTFAQVTGDGLRLEGASVTAGEFRNNLWVAVDQVEGDGDLVAEANGFWMVGDNQIGSASDVTDDPMLDGDHRHGAGSPLVDAGVDVGAVFGGAAPDIGFHEVDADPCGALPDPGGTGGDDGAAGTAGDGADGSTGDGSASGATGGAQDGPQEGTSAASSGTHATSAGADGGDGEGSGCGCRTRPDRTAARWWLALLALLRVRRRPVRAWYSPRRARRR